jgi:hypothetical protein
MSSADLVVLRYIPETTFGVTPDDSAKAVGTLTGTGNVADNDTVTIAGKVYTFKAILTETDGYVKVGASLTASLANLKNAINREGGVVGTDYATATTEHPTVEATASNATTVSLRAKAGGVGGNSLATIEGSTVLSFGAATLTGGTNSTVSEWRPVRYTGEGVNFNIENTQSAEINPKRVETDLVQTAASAAGDVNIELSYDTYKDWLAMVFCNEWTPGSGSTEELENGSDLESMTLQKHFQDMQVPQYHNYRGTVVEGLSLTMEIGKIVSGSFSLMSLGLDSDTGVSDTTIEGSTTLPQTETTPMNAVTNLQDFTIDGVPYTGCISKLSLQMKNNVRAIQCLGSLVARRMKLGTLEVTGDAEFYFEDGTQFRTFVRGQEFDFSFTLEDGDGNSYQFFFERCKFESGEVVAGGKNTDVMFSSKWRGLYSVAADRVLKMIATPAS